jgi:hypothetical protein
MESLRKLASEGSHEFSVAGKRNFEGRDKAAETAGKISGPPFLGDRGVAPIPSGDLNSANLLQGSDGLPYRIVQIGI